jgi:hypothetical protein
MEKNSFLGKFQVNEIEKTDESGKVAGKRQ